MEKNIIFGSCLPPFGNCADRFVLSGYSSIKRSVPEMIKLAAKVKDLSGIELVGTWHIHDENIQDEENNPEHWFKSFYGSSRFMGPGKMG